MKRLYPKLSLYKIERGRLKECALLLHFPLMTSSLLTGPPPALEAIGCYKDKHNDRALPTLYHSFRPYIKWSNLNETIRGCATVARDMGYEYFGVQYYGECWSSENATYTYAKHGVQTKAKECMANVGGKYTNFVYRILLVSL